jgi:hypothetical protein
MGALFDVGTFPGSVVATLVAGAIAAAAYWLWTSYLDRRPVRVLVDVDKLKRVRSEWPNDENGQPRHVSITTIRVGVTHSRSGPLRLKAIIEVISDMAFPIGFPALQVSDEAEGEMMTVLPPSRWWHKSEKAALFDFIQFHEGKEWAWFCFAIPSHECLVPRHGFVTLRFEAEGETVGREILEVRTHEVGGVPIPISIQRKAQQDR